MPVLPGLLALTNIADGALAVAADVRGNFAAIQAETNSLLGTLDDGVAGQFLKGVGTTISFDYPPGYEFNYAEATVAVTTAATTEGGAVQVAQSGSVTFDGATIVLVEFWTPSVSHTVAGTQVVLTLFEDAAVLGRARHGTDVNGGGGPVKIERRRTPSAGAHTYTVKAHGNAAGTTTVAAGAGGSGVDLPLFVRLTKV